MKERIKIVFFISLLNKNLLLILLPINSERRKFLFVLLIKDWYVKFTVKCCFELNRKTFKQKYNILRCLKKTSWEEKWLMRCLWINGSWSLELHIREMGYPVARIVEHQWWTMHWIGHKWDRIWGWSQQSSYHLRLYLQ